MKKRFKKAAPLCSISPLCHLLTLLSTEEIDILSSQRTQLEVLLEETKKTLQVKQGEINHVLEEVQQLKGKLDSEVPAQIGEKAKLVEQEQENLNSRKTEVQAKQAGRMLRKNELSKGVTFYKERLGLSFERMPDNSLSFRLTLIDPENPARPFSFAILVNAKDRYEVLRCEPRVDYESQLVNLNESNNFSTFVQQMRRLFKKMV